MVIDRGRVVAEGTAAAIKARVERKRVRFTTPHRVEPALFEGLHVEGLSTQDGVTTLLTPRPEEILRRLFEAGIDVCPTWRWWARTWKRPFWRSPGKALTKKVHCETVRANPKWGREGEREVAAAWPMLIAQTRSELLQLLRDPAFIISSVTLPTIFFAFFGLPVVDERTAGTGAGDYLLASFGAYGVISVMLFSFGAGVASERGRKTDVLMRATPLRPAVLLCAKTLSALLFAFATLVVRFFGRVAGGVELGTSAWVTLTYRLLLGSTPFVFLGFAVGYLARPTSAAPVIQLIYLPIAFASGLFVPLGRLPEIVQEITPYLPTYRYAELAWSAVGANTKPLLASALWLAGYGVAFLAAAIWAYCREDLRRFG